MSFETTGILHKVFEEQSKSETFKTREFVIKLDGNYPQFIKFQLTQDRCDLIGNYKEGDNIKVSFDLRGREWNEKYFTNLNACKIDSAEQAAPVSQGGASETKTEGFNPIAEPVGAKGQESLSAEDFDDLPF